MNRSRLPLCPRQTAPRLLLAPLVFVALAGCAHQTYRAQPLIAEKTAQAFDARSLTDPALQNFLRENLSRVPAAAAPWDFETLAWVAFYYNPTLDVARAQWESARAAATPAGARPNPTLGLTPGYSTNAGAGVSPWFPALTFDFPIETAGKRGHRTAAAQHAAEAAHQAVFSAAWQVRRELRRAVLDFTSARARLDRLRASAAFQQHIVTLLEQRLKAGAIAAPELAPAHLAALRAEADVAAAERQLPLARQRIAVALGLPVAALADATFSAPPALPPFSSAQLAAARRTSLQSRPDLLAALARYAAAESTLALEIARQYPDVHLGPGYQWDQGQDKWSVGLTFELPLFHHNEGPIAEADAHRREAAVQFLAAQAQALAEIDAAATAQTAAAAQLDSLRRIRDQLGRQQTQLAARRHAGAADRLETETGELEISTGELALADAEAQAALATGELEDALQIPFAHLSALEKTTAATPLSAP